MDLHLELHPYYNFPLVVLSILIAMLAAYAALDLAAQVRKEEGGLRFFWLLFGAFAVGTGIWAMHYIGMYALQFPIPVQYDWPTVALSIVAAILASSIALYLVSGKTLLRWHAVAGGLFMGIGISSMHYIGMEAMRLKAKCVYSGWMVALSVAVAISLSYCAIRTSFHFKAQFGKWSWLKAGSAILLGLAISAMHYTGMSAVTFFEQPQMNDSTSRAIGMSTMGLSSIVAITILLLFVVLVSSYMDRVFARQANVIAEGRLQTQIIFDNLREGIIVLDLDRNIIRSNRAARALLGVSENYHARAEIAKTFEVFLPTGEPLAPAALPSVLAVRGEFLQSCELKIRRTDTGKTVIAEVSTAPILNSAGEMVQIILSYRDVTEPRSLDEARVRLAAIVESSEDAIIGKDDKGIVTSWNLGAQKLFGYSPEEMIGQPITRLIPEDRIFEEEEILGRIRSGETVDHIETVRKKKNGQFIHISLTISPIRDSSGAIVGASKIVRNISDRKNLEQQLIQSQKMDAIGQLTGGIAHDFNNLLGVIIGNLDLLEGEVRGNEKALKRVHTAQKASIRGAELTRRLLAFSSHEELRPQAISLNTSIRNAVELASHALGPEVRIVLQLNDAMPSVFVDASGLESAMLNLLVNARDAMARGGVITITSDITDSENNIMTESLDQRGQGKCGFVSVSDTGCGMSREVLTRAFEPFFSTKLRGKGTGLGLAMVYGFIKQSGGNVRLYSEVGYGTTVSFYLPLAGNVPAVHRAAVRTLAVRKGSVLVVDDELDLLEVAASYLTDMGFTVLQAKDGPEALDLIKSREDIGLLITDILMPGGMNGAELAMVSRQIRPEIKVIYCSGFPADAIAERSVASIDGPLLRKPYQREDFKTMVYNVMSGAEPDIQ